MTLRRPTDAPPLRRIWGADVPASGAVPPLLAAAAGAGLLADPADVHLGLHRQLPRRARWAARRHCAAGLLLGGVLLWEVALRSQMGVSISFLEEIWSRNLGHVFVSPLRPRELVAALIAMSVIRMLVGVLPAILLAWVFYAFNLFALGPVLVLFFVNLMIMGWAVALGVVSLILRHGAGAEALAWSVLFGLTPFSAVFYPGLGAAGLAAADRAGAAVGACVRGDARGDADRGDRLGPPGRRVRAERRVDGRRRAAVRAAVPRRPACAARCSASASEAMSTTAFWLIRHAIVEENARAVLVRRDGRAVVRDQPDRAGSRCTRALAARLPRPAAWIVTPLSRTRRTAEAIFAAGYPRRRAGGGARPDRAVARRMAGPAARRAARRV